jgi:ABC-type phosphate/phosphonate transport system substrate-binding protein
MIASLPMYDWPEVRSATDAWWKGLGRHLGVAVGLDRSLDYVAVWRRSDLAFSQTCGYPFTHEFKGLLNYISTPHYSVDGCVGADYCSLVMAREKQPLEAFRGAVAAVNTRDSMSGMLALQLVFTRSATGGKFFAKAFETGGHVNSMKAVREGKADVCAVDAVCVGLARRYRPDYLQGLVEIARSPLVPALPFVTRRPDMDVLRNALVEAFHDESLDAIRGQLFLGGQSVLRPNAYERITDLERDIQKAGGLDLL